MQVATNPDDMLTLVILGDGVWYRWRRRRTTTIPTMSYSPR